MRSKFTRQRFLPLLLAGLLLLASPATGIIIFDEGHVDFSVSFDGTTWELTVTDDFSAFSYPLDEVLFYAKDEPWVASASAEGSRLARPTGSQWDFLGVDAGEDIWIFPSNTFGAPILGPGFNTGGVLSSAVESDIFIDLLGMNYIGDGNGEFSLWSNGPTVYMATSLGSSQTNQYSMPAQGHTHVNWGFSALGLYELTFQASAITGFDGDNNPIWSYSDPSTLLVGVGVIPEPGTLLLFFLAIAGWFAMTFRKRGNQRT